MQFKAVAQVRDAGENQGFCLVGALERDPTLDHDVLECCGEQT